MSKDIQEFGPYFRTDGTPKPYGKKVAGTVQRSILTRNILATYEAGVRMD
jgi:hypothetical protein